MRFFVRNVCGHCADPIYLQSLVIINDEKVRLFASSSSSFFRSVLLSPRIVVVRCKLLDRRWRQWWKMSTRRLQLASMYAHSPYEQSLATFNMSSYTERAFQRRTSNGSLLLVPSSSLSLSSSLLLHIPHRFPKWYFMCFVYHDWVILLLLLQQRNRYKRFVRFVIAIALPEMHKVSNAEQIHVHTHCVCAKL